MHTLRRTVLVTALLALAACGHDDGGGQTSASSGHTGTASPTPTTSVSTSPTASAATPSITPSGTPTSGPSAARSTSGVYFLEDTRAGLRLAREVRTLPGAGPVKEAVQAMIAGPRDPDYGSTWNPRTRVLSATSSGSVITVDLSAAARRADVGSEGAQRMVQQLVYTATEAAGRPQAKVRLLIAGQPAGDLWGAVSWTKPAGRDDPAAVRVLVQIDTPRDGATVSSPVTVSGEADTFEANVPWQVLDGTGKVVRHGFATAQQGMQFSPYSFTVTLPPGSYTVRVTESDASGGEGGTPMSDTKRITVR